MRGFAPRAPLHALCSPLRRLVRYAAHFAGARSPAGCEIRFSCHGHRQGVATAIRRGSAIFDGRRSTTPTAASMRLRCGAGARRVSTVVDRQARALGARRAGSHAARVARRQISFAHLSLWRTRLARVRSMAQALLDRGLTAERPLAILSGNERQPSRCCTAGRAAYAGVLYAPVSPAYSLVSQKTSARCGQVARVQ